MSTKANHTLVIESKKNSNEIIHYLNLQKITINRAWYIKIHSIIVENLTDKESKIFVLTSSLVTDLTEKVFGGGQHLSEVPLTLFEASSNLKNCGIFPQNLVFKVTNLCSKCVWTFKNLQKEDITHLKFKIHFSLMCD